MSTRDVVVEDPPKVPHWARKAWSWRGLHIFRTMTLWAWAKTLEELARDDARKGWQGVVRGVGLGNRRWGLFLVSWRRVR